MNGILGMTELLLSTNLSEKQRHFGESVQRSARALLDIVNDVLDFSKIESGKLKLDRTEFDVREAIEDVVDFFAESARTKSLELVVWIAQDVPARAVGDPGRLRQILGNLVSNAIKFTDSGEVIVRASLLRERQDSLQLRLEVTDTGIGVAGEEQEHIFTAFSQVDGSSARRYGGSGLGLGIAKELVEAMGGEIGVVSEEDVGSSFWFTVILERAAHSSTSAREVDLRPLQDRRVLVVDDHEMSRECTLALVESWGIAGEAVSSGAEALAMLGNPEDGVAQPFDAAIVDLEMPGTDGFTMSRALRERGWTELAVVLLARSSPDKDELARGGIDICLTKPVRSAKLLEALQTHLVSSDNRTGSSREADPSAPAGRPARILVVEDNVVNQEVVRAMLESLGHDCELVAGGRDAVDAVDNADFDLVLMDVQLPDLNGMEATRQIRERVRRKNGNGNGNDNDNDDGVREMPIVAVTTAGVDGYRDECREAGMNGFLGKPFSLEQLQAVLHRWLPETDTKTDIRGRDDLVSTR
jgi:CheY-like chemotaxis protein